MEKKIKSPTTTGEVKTPFLPSDEIYEGSRPDKDKKPTRRQRRVEADSHEADLAVVERLLDRKNETLDAGTATLLLWKCRRDPRMVAAAAEWLETHSYARTTFDDVELFLPQLAHMLIHLDVDWPAGTLERFALVVAQQSPHLALQLHWILRAAMEDYSPKADGSGGDELYYRRCAHLDEDVESVVAHGSARPYDLDELFHNKKITNEQQSFKGASIAKRMVDAALRPVLRAVEGGTRVTLLDPSFVPHRQASYQGFLEWQKPNLKHKGKKTRSCCCRCCCRHRQPKWIKRAYAKIEGRSLLVYLNHQGPAQKKRKSILVRALPLDGALVETNSVDSGRRKKKITYFEFEIRPKRETAAFVPIILRTTSREARDEWVSHLTTEAARAPRVPPDEEAYPARQRLGSYDDTYFDDSSPSRKSKRATDEDEDNSLHNKSSMDDIAQRRYAFFEAERDFADELVAVAERLRKLPRRDRQKNLPMMLRSLKVPRLAYLPLCNSTDMWRTVLRVVDDEGSVFNTKERCPCLLFFETAFEKGLEGLDVASVIHAHIAESGIMLRKQDLTRLEEEKEEDEENSDDFIRLVASENNIEPFSSEKKEEDAILKKPQLFTQRSSSEPPTLQQKEAPLPKRASIWRPETSMNPLVNEAETKRTVSFSQTGSSSSTSPDIGAAPRQQTQRSSRRLSEQAERIHARASRVLDFWRGQLQTATHWVEQQVPQPTSVFRSFSLDDDDDDDDDDVSEYQYDEAQTKGGPGGAGSTYANSVYGTGSQILTRSRRFQKRASYGEGFGAKEEKIRSRSEKAKADPSWSLRAIIVKSNDDLRQEVFVVQLISRYARLFASKKLPLYLKPYRIIALSATTGMIELVPDSTSLDKLYGKPGYPGSLKAHFIESYGEEGSADFENARLNFIQSAAASAFACYILSLKDRHNGNVLLDSRGRLVHIDFGFVLGFKTGGKASLEQFAPFKITRGMVDLMGKDGYTLFVDAFYNALLAARDVLDEVATLIEIMQFKSSFPCFTQANRGVNVAQKFRDRHFPHLDPEKLKKKAELLVKKSIDNTGTYLYDVFQYKTNRIAY